MTLRTNAIEFTDYGIIRPISKAIRTGDIAAVRELFRNHPEYKEYQTVLTVSWLHDAAFHGQIEIVQMLLEMGADINKGGEANPLIESIRQGNVAMADYLLAHGADPNLGRTLISAINRESEDVALQLVKLLVEHGADFDRVFPWFNDETLTFTPLTWAIANGKTTIADYLRSKGAAEPERKPAIAAAEPKNLSDEILAYFTEHFGPVQLQSLIEIVPSDPPVAIHVVPASSDSRDITLFTTGMSERALTTPQGADDFRFAELFIQLPGDWPLGRDSLADPNFGWPIHWLRSTAKYPHQQGTWLGGPATIIANGEPPAPLAPNTQFTSLLLLAENEFVSRDGRKIVLYRMSPLSTEERDLELREGIAALMRAFDASSVPFVVDLNRRNVAVP